MASGIVIHTTNKEVIWQQAAEFWVELLRTHQNEKALLLLSGGSVVNLYNRIKYYVLRLPAGEAGIKDNNIAIAQVDERFQQGSKEDINAYQIEKTGLWEVCKKKNIPYYLISQEGTLEETARKYNRQLEALFEHFDYKIGVLGIGEDVHTAGLLPGYKSSWDIDKYAVGYKIDYRQDNAMALSCRELIRQRITITPKVISQLDHAIVVATSEKKREALAKINDMKIKDMDKYPAVILRKIKKVDLFTDINIKY